MTFSRKIQGVDSGRFSVPEALALPFCGSNDKYTDAAFISDSSILVKLRHPAASVFQSPFPCRVKYDRKSYPVVEYSGDDVVTGAAWNGDFIFWTGGAVLRSGRLFDATRCRPVHSFFRYELRPPVGSSRRRSVCKYGPSQVLFRSSPCGRAFASAPSRGGLFLTMPLPLQATNEYGRE